MYLGYKYRIYPTEEQERSLASIFGTTRFVYNWALNERTRLYKSGQKSGFAQSSKEFTKLRNSKEYEWLKEVNRDVAERPLRALDAAYKRFFKTKTGFPAFKKKNGNQRATYRSITYGFKVKDGVLSIPKLGTLNVVWTRKLPSNPTQLTISKTKSGKYYVSFRVEVQERRPTKRKRAVGLDLGIKSFLTLSNGELVENPTPFEKDHKKLAKAQRKLARKQFGSHRRNAQKVRVAKIHERIAHKRADYQHKVARSLVRRFDRIYIEDLNVAGMVKNHNLARALSDVSFGTFRTLLQYKAKLYGKQVIPVGRFFPSSKLCSACGIKNDALTLADRQWTCSCGTTHDRDVNAAKNILAAGLAVSARGVSNVNV